ncbi:hypothetical protein EDC01DRAFT_134967 [Geopyxis carbonaria]|nr:hypothetical protein EDC01DRAFT_134967 [Geopyxis carbonaria]
MLQPALRRFPQTLTALSTRRCLATMTAAPYTPRILILGGAYAGLSVAMNLTHLLAGTTPPPSAFPQPPLPAPKHTKPTVTILDERDGCYHTLATPLLHTSPTCGLASAAWRRFADMPGLRAVRGTVQSVDTAAKVVTHSGGSEAYDYLVVATGLHRAYPAIPKALEKTQYLRDTGALTSRLATTAAAAGTVVVVGGGAVGVEFAAEVKHSHPAARVVLVHSRAELLSNEPLPPAFKAKVLDVLTHDVGVETVLGERATEVGADHVVLAGGRRIDGVVLNCVFPPKPRTSFLPAAALDDAGYVAVDRSLSFASQHYAAGDVARTPAHTIKRAGGAMAGGAVVAHNIVKTFLAAEDPDCEEYTQAATVPDVPAMMALAMGDTAVGFHPASGVSAGVEVRKGSFGDDLGLGRK